MEENLETSTVETTDNSASDEITSEDIAKALEEPDESTKETVKETEPDVGTEKQSDNTLDVPDKFKGKDGNVDVNNLLKSYKELESYSSSEKAKWQEERAELLKAKEELDKQRQAQEEQAKSQGYSSALEMQQEYSLIQTEANEYAKYLEYVEDPEQVKNMLIQFANSPTEKLRNDIELEFSPDVIKAVTRAVDRQRYGFEQQRQTMLETQKMSNIENVISTSVNQNKEIFAYKPFETLFTSTLQRYGDNFTQKDANVLISAVYELKDVFRQEFEQEYGIKRENDKATDKLAGISNTKSAPVSSPYRDASQLGKQEWAKAISDYI